MKAAVCARYGLKNLRLEEVVKPSPKDNEVLVEVYASCVNQNTYSIAAGTFLVRAATGLMKPKFPTPGGDLVGKVAAVGKDVKQFKPGDAVYGCASDNGFGALAEYVSVPERTIAIKPANLSFAEAAAVPEAALVALQGLRNQGYLAKGQKILIYSASGGIGTFAVQIAKAFGAEVTAVCSGKNTEMVRKLGADYVIDYTKEDFTRNGKTYDLIFAIRASRPARDIKRSLTARGIYVSTGGPSFRRLFQDMLMGPLLSKKDGKKLGGAWVERVSQADLSLLRELIEAGKVKPVIDKIYPLSLVADAFRYYGTGRARGKVVVTIEDE
jgi:NADPH:quinone reductase-like Zn-dependent oxidoreductase